MKTFSIFEAKNILSEMIASAECNEPQVITKDGREVAVIISYREFQRLTAKKESLVAFLLNNPSRNDDVEIDLTRSKAGSGRKTIDFSLEEYE